MKKKLRVVVLVAILAICVGAMCACGAKDGSKLFKPYERFTAEEVIYSDENVTLDGALNDDIWANATWYDMVSTAGNRSDNSGLENLRDANYSVTAVVNEKGVYVGVKSDDNLVFVGEDIKDNTIDHVAQRLVNAFAKTGVSIYLADPRNVYTQRGQILEVGLGADASVAVQYDAGDGKGSQKLSPVGIQAGSTIKGTKNTADTQGYELEAFISWDAIPWADENDLPDSVSSTFASVRYTKAEMGAPRIWEMLDANRGQYFGGKTNWETYSAGGHVARPEGATFGTLGYNYSDRGFDLTGDVEGDERKVTFSSDTRRESYLYAKNITDTRIFAEFTAKLGEGNTFGDPDVYPMLGIRMSATERVEGNSQSVFAGVQFRSNETDKRGWFDHAFVSDPVNNANFRNSKSIYRGNLRTDPINADKVKITLYRNGDKFYALFNGIMYDMRSADYIAANTPMDVALFTINKSVEITDYTFVSGDAAEEKGEPIIAEFLPDGYTIDGVADAKWDTDYEGQTAALKDADASGKTLTFKAKLEDNGLYFTGEAKHEFFFDGNFRVYEKPDGGEGMNKNNWANQWDNTGFEGVTYFSVAYKAIGGTIVTSVSNREVYNAIAGSVMKMKTEETGEEGDKTRYTSTIEGFIPKASLIASGIMAQGGKDVSVQVLFINYKEDDVEAGEEKYDILETSSNFLTDGNNFKFNYNWPLCVPYFGELNRFDLGNYIVVKANGIIGNPGVTFGKAGAVMPTGDVDYDNDLGAPTSTLRITNTGSGYRRAVVNEMSDTTLFAEATIKIDGEYCGNATFGLQFIKENGNSLFFGIKLKNSPIDEIQCEYYAFRPVDNNPDMSPDFGQPFNGVNFGEVIGDGVKFTVYRSGNIFYLFVNGEYVTRVRNDLIGAADATAVAVYAQHSQATVSAYSFISGADATAKFDEHYKSVYEAALGVVGDFNDEVWSEIGGITFGKKGDKDSIVVPSAGPNKHAYVRNVSGTKLYAEAVISNVNVNWGFIGFGFRDTANLNNFAYAGLKYQNRTDLFFIASNAVDPSSWKEGETGYHLKANDYYPQYPEASNGDTGLRVGVYADTATGKITLYVNGLRAAQYDSALQGKNLYLTLYSRDASAVYSDYKFLSGDEATAAIPVDPKYDGSLNYVVTSDDSLLLPGNWASTDELAVKNVTGKKLYAEAVIGGNTMSNWGFLGFALRAPSVSDKRVAAGLHWRNSNADNREHKYIVTDIADANGGAGVKPDGIRTLLTEKESFDLTRGDQRATGVKVAVYADGSGKVALFVNDKRAFEQTYSDLADKDLTVSIFSNSANGFYRGCRFLVGDDAAAAVPDEPVGDISDTVKSEIGGITFAKKDGKDSIYVPSAGFNKHAYVKNVSGTKLYAEAVISNVSTNWGFAGFAFRDKSNLSNFVMAGLNYKGDNNVEFKATNADDPSNVGATTGATASYAAPSAMAGENYSKQQVYDRTKGNDGVRIAVYADTATGKIVIYAKGMEVLKYSATNLVGKDVYLTLFSRSATIIYSDYAFLGNAEADNATPAGSDLFGDYSAAMTATASFKELADKNGVKRVGVYNTNGNKEVYVKNVSGKRLYAEAIISDNDTTNWGTMGFAFHQVGDPTKRVVAGFAYRGTNVSDHRYVISTADDTNGGDPYIIPDGIKTVLTAQQSYDRTHGAEKSTGVKLAAYIDETGKLTVYVEGAKVLETTLADYADKEMAISLFMRDGNAIYSNYKFLVGDDATAALPSDGSDKFGDYSDTVKAGLTYNYLGNDSLYVNGNYGSTGHLYVKNVTGKKLYAEAVIGGNSVTNWGTMGFAFHPSDDVNTRMVAGLVFRGYGEDRYTGHRYVITGAEDTNGGEPYITPNGTNSVLTAQQSYDRVHGTEKDKGVKVAVYVDETGKITLFVEGMKAVETTAAVLAGKDMVMSIYFNSADGFYKNCKLLSGDAATEAFNAINS